ncbi:MAG TPA: thioredoxin family protein [Stenotrophomonas sp.]
MIPFAFRSASLALVCLLAACQRDPAPANPPASAASTPAQPAAIAWRQGDVDDAFAEARQSGRPVLLYWGAVWCPPCNKLKATLFKQPDFIALTDNFVPVYLDGDTPGAQSWGEQFGVRGYPTLVVLTPDRREITRLSGGNDSLALVEALKRAASRRSSAAEVLQAALQQPSSLAAEDWALLADYGWGVDANRLAGERPARQVLDQLVEHAPTAPLQRRFALLAADADEHPEVPSSPAQRTALRSTLDKVLADPAEVSANQAVLTYSGASLVARASQGNDDAIALGQRLLATLDANAKGGASVDDRLALIVTEINLQRDRQPDAPLPPALISKTREAVAAADAESRTAYERQATISTAVYVLQLAGDNAGAEKLLLAELPRSHTPYYYMPDLAELAEKRGDKATALAWLRKAYLGAEGPATRVQWGVLYIEGLVRLAPDDAATIEQATDQVIANLDAQPESYHQRTRQRFERLGKTLTEWSRTHQGAQTLVRLQARMLESCARGQSVEAGNACKQWLQG